MRPKSIPPFPDPVKAGPGVPRNFPEQAVLSDDGIEAAKRESASTMKSEANPGEDPLTESGLPDNDPERPRQTPEEQSNR
jgi:hypothetical protein